MASDYGLNFGFRRSDESVRVSEGRFKTPADGNALLLGTAVAIDAEADGYLTVSGSGDPLIPGFSGLLLQEEIHLPSIYDVQLLDSFGLGVAKKDRLSVLTSGAGTKVWFQNTDQQDRADGRSVSSVAIWDSSGVGVGDFLGWTGSLWAGTATPGEQWMVVTAVNGEYVEAVLVK